MHIWVDADACPSDIKKLLFKAADKRQVQMTLVANQGMYIPRSKYISREMVPTGLNQADQRIVELLSSGDLVITADIPLAADVVKKGGIVLDPRGELLTDKNIGERLAVRNLLDELRGGDQISGGPASFSSKDVQNFANQFDRILTKLLK